MPRKIKLMISSRCSDLLEVNKERISFTELRTYVLEEIEKEKFLDVPLFEVMISEYLVDNIEDTSWNACLKEIIDSDIVIVWFTGHEGYMDPGKSIGICRAEYVEALQSNPSKVFMLDFRDLKVLNSAGVEFDSGVKHDSPFAKEIGRSDRWLQRTELKKCTTIGNLKLEVKAKCFGILVAAVSNFVISGSTTLRQSAHTFGEGLVWNKLNYRFRQEAIGHYLTKTVNRFLAEPDFLPLQKSMITHAMPDAMSVVEARELVGRPFLKDLEHLPNVDIGPVHIIGVYKNATENQIRDIIGHQDVAIIQDGFGFYVWDLVNHIQLIYITQCKDPEVTAIQTQAFFTWLRVQDETRFVIDRASRRKEILKTIDAQKVELKGTLK